MVPSSERKNSHSLGESYQSFFFSKKNYSLLGSRSIPIPFLCRFPKRYFHFFKTDALEKSVFVRV